MKRTLTALICSTLSSLVFSTSISKLADQLINQVDPNINMGIVVVDLSTGKTLFERNPTRLFIPASNMKLFSDAAALMVLGPDYRFKNQLSTDASVVDKGVLKGSLYLHLPGDPSFTQHDLTALLSQLSTWGIQRITGNVVIVSNHGVVDPHAPGWVAKDFTYSYGASVAPLMIDENRIIVTVNPADRPGQPALIELSHLDTGIQLNNQVNTSPNPSGCGVSFNMDQDNKLTVRGCVGLGQWAVQQGIAIRNPLKYAQDFIKINLNQLHIQFDGQVILGQAPTPSLLLATETSKPMAALLADTLKPSDNLYADSLFLHAAAKLEGKPLDWPAAQGVVTQFLEKQTGISLQGAILIDGSGLSRNDRLTAQQTVGLLRFLHDRFPLSYEYISALPVAGHDGTLQRRFRKPSEQGLLRAKTGTMAGVMSLSGYLYTANAHTLAFAIFVNRTPGTNPKVAGRYRSLVDTLCDFFLQQKPDENLFARILTPHARVAYQQHATAADLRRGYGAKWRSIEASMKRSLKGQPVTVLFRGDQLVLNDQNATASPVWIALQALRKKYTVTVALQGNSSPDNSQSPPGLLWVKKDPAADQAKRTWTIRESVT